MSAWVAFGSAIVGALIGGGLTGISSWLATNKQLRNAIHLQQQQKEQAINGLLQAMHDELETIWDRYKDTIGSRLESLPQNEPLLSYYIIGQDYFTIYNSNAFLIGHIGDADLRIKIVRVYTAARGLVDSFRMNNELIQRYEYWHNLYQVTQSQTDYNRFISYYSSLTKYADGLRQQHNSLKQSISDLLRELRKRGVLSGTSNK